MYGCVWVCMDDTQAFVWSVPYHVSYKAPVPIHTAYGPHTAGAGPRPAVVGGKAAESAYHTTPYRPYIPYHTARKG